MKMLMTPPEGYPLVLANTLCMLYQRVKPLPPNMLVSERVSTKQLLFHNAGYSIKYSQVQRVDTTLTKIILDKLIENGNFPVPPNLLEVKCLQFAADNIDIIQETFDSKGTFHATQMVAFNRGEPTGQGGQQLPLGKGGFLKIPEELQQLNDATEAIAPPIPRFAVDVDLESYEPDPILITTANIKDVCWLLTRYYRTHNQSVPAWMV